MNNNDDVGWFGWCFRIYSFGSASRRRLIWSTCRGGGSRPVSPWPASTAHSHRPRPAEENIRITRKINLRYTVQLDFYAPPLIIKKIVQSL